VSLLREERAKQVGWGKEKRRKGARQERREGERVRRAGIEGQRVGGDRKVVVTETEIVR